MPLRQHTAHARTFGTSTSKMADARCPSRPDPNPRWHLLGLSVASWTFGPRIFREALVSIRTRGDRLRNVFFQHLVDATPPMIQTKCFLLTPSRHMFAIFDFSLLLFFFFYCCVESANMSGMDSESSHSSGRGNWRKKLSILTTTPRGYKV